MLKIANIPLQSPLILAPLAGYSDLPFRLLCNHYGAGLCVSEMISCHGLAYKQQKTLQMLQSTPDDRPVSFQLFGADVSVMAKAADLLNEFQPDLVDINMGCPVKKVTKKGAGAALMATPDIAKEIINEVVKNSTAPVTVKFRKGVNDDTINCIEFAKMAEDTGASAIAIHGRTWAQGFSGKADWQSVTDVKKSVSIPVIGNGDIETYSEALERMATTGCDGIMIGRGALGKPWIFSPDEKPRDLKLILFAVKMHLDLMQQYLEVERLLAVIKNHISRYFKNIQGSSAVRKMIFDSKSFSLLSSQISALEEKTDR